MIEFTPLNPETLVQAPCLIEQTLCVAQEDGSPRQAGTKEAATILLDAWKDEEASSEEAWDVVYKPIEYSSSTEDPKTPLHGYWVQNGSIDQTTASILLFHTAVGPHDLFLLWKAAALAHRFPYCRILVCDLLGDDSGWAWDDKSRYQSVKDALLVQEQGVRSVLRQRIQAALDFVNSDDHPVAVLGWCMGGFPALEILRMHHPRIRGMVTFHGVFPLDSSDPINGVATNTPCEMLICTGTQDPFCSNESIEHVLQVAQDNGVRTSLLQLEAKHGFTNPAQAVNTNPAFDYSEEAAAKAWRQALNVVERAVGTSE